MNEETEISKNNQNSQNFPYTETCTPNINPQEDLNSKSNSNSNSNLELDLTTNIKNPSNKNYDQIKKTPQNCTEILAECALSICKYATVTFYKEFITLICLFRKGLNEKGRAFKIKRCQTQNDQIEYCDEKDISVAPEISNYFISELFPIYFSSLKLSEGLNYLGMTEELIINLIHFIRFLCNWLYINNYCDIKIDINTDP